LWRALRFWVMSFSLGSDEAGPFFLVDLLKYRARLAFHQYNSYG
jgi:hypothetical protein